MDNLLSGSGSGVVTGVLFAAGRGQRLRPLTDDTPKPALLVGDKPLGAYGLELLAALGARVAVNISWLPEKARSALEPYVPDDTEWLLESPSPLGTAGTLRALLPALAGTFAVANADVLTDLDMGELLVTHRRMGLAGTLAVLRVETGADFAVEGDRATLLIDRKADRSSAGVRYLGVAVFERDEIAPLLLAEPPPSGLAEVVFGPLAAQRRLAMHFHRGMAMDVGTPAALEAARRAVADGEGD